jgi:tRNA threonylcarbamoyladenosine biosynthesis protein TsaE
MSSRVAMLDLISHSPEQTRRIGAHLGRLAQPGDVYLLRGPLGSGKTTLVQGIARGLDVEEAVRSPTFVLASEHRGHLTDGTPVRLYHIDLYRLEEPGELATFGLLDYLDDPGGIVVVEWPERASFEVLEHYLVIELEFLADTKRRLAFYPIGERHQRLVERLRAEVAGGRRRPAAPGD